MTSDLLPARTSQWLKGVLDLCVLALLSDGERYGYEIARLLDEAGLGLIKGGTLYPLLARLEAESLVTTKWRPSGRGPERKYYSLTSEGQTVLKTAAPMWKTFTQRVARVLEGDE